MSLSRHILRAPRLLSQCQRLAVARQQQCNASDDVAKLALTFTTPSEVFYRDVEVKQVDVPTQAGNFGVFVNHVPTIGTLKPGVMSVFEKDGTEKKFFVGGGAVTVNNDSTVQVLSEEAHPLDRFDTQSVNANLQKAQNELSSAKSDEERAAAQIAVDCLEALKVAV